MKKYSPFTFSLEHLNAFYTEYFEPAKGEKPGRKYRCLVEFGTHCFTRSLNSNKNENLSDYDPSLHYYEENRETRIFCLERYILSLDLPRILKEEIYKNKCFFTSANDKFLRISKKKQNGEFANYEIYFSLKKSKNCDVHIFVNSAYIRSSDYQSRNNGLRRKPISFFVLLDNTINNKRIKRPL